MDRVLFFALILLQLFIKGMPYLLYNIYARCYSRFLYFLLLAFAQRSSDSTSVSVPAAISSVISTIICFVCCAALGCYFCRDNRYTASRSWHPARRHPVVYAYTTPRSHTNTQINTVSTGNTVPPAPPYTASYAVPPTLPYTAPPAAPYAPTSVPLAPHKELSGYNADVPPPYSSLPPPSVAQQSAEIVQQSQVEDPAESSAEVQTPPGIIRAVSDDSETQKLETSQDQEQSLRLTNQEPLPSGTSSELEMQMETIEFQDNCSQENVSKPHTE